MTVDRGETELFQWFKSQNRLWD